MAEKWIIHFTKHLKDLVRILNSNSLRISYCKEEFIVGTKAKSRAAHPMVCFSQFDLKETRSKKKLTYGDYGVGFLREFAIDRNVSPVIYLPKDSTPARGLGRLLTARRNKEIFNLSGDLRLAIMQLKCFTKNESGLNSNQGQENFNFKDENEWRFVPTETQIGGGRISLGVKTFMKNEEKWNEKLSCHPFGFKLTDVAVVFVRKSCEVARICRDTGVSNKLVKTSRKEV